MDTTKRSLAGLSRLLCLLLLLALCLSAAGCGRRKGAAEDAQPPAQTAAAPTAVPTVAIGGREIEVTAADITAVLSEGETEKLDLLPALRSADLSGSENVREIAAWAARHPEVDVTWTVRLPNGSVLDSHAETADLSGCSGTELADMVEPLSLLPALKSVDLGTQRPEMDWDSIAAFRAALPTLSLSYRFTLYDTDCDLADTAINLYHIPVDDDGVLLEQVMDLMPQLESVDLDGCELPMWRCEEINLKHPDVKVVFRVWFGSNYSVRTDTEMILASKPSVGGELTPDNIEGLYYCHDVKYLDVGHNTMLTDLSFVKEMPKLEVAVLAMCNWSDATPLSFCPELEYIEMQTTLCTDLRPLSGLTKLRHLNVCNIGADVEEGPRPSLTDITPLYPLTGLERLWIGGYNEVPHEQIEEMQRRAPKCEINDTVADPHGGRWRCIDMADFINTYVDTYHERYIKLREQFREYDNSAYSFSWNDPLYS